MSKVALSAHLPASVDDIWEIVGNFGALHAWHPGVLSSTLEEDGTLRRLALPGGAELVERLEQLDAERHLYRYTVESGPLPVANYVAEVRVSAHPDGGSTVEWSTDFAPAGVAEEQATRIVRGTLSAGLDNLNKMFGR